VPGSITDEEILAWASDIYPVSDLSKPADTREDELRRQEAEHYHLSLARRLAHRAQFTEAARVLKAFRPDSEFAKEISEISALLRLSGPEAMSADVVSPWGHDTEKASIFVAKSALPTDALIVVFSPDAVLANLDALSLHPVLKATGCHIVYVLDVQAKHFLKGFEWDKPSKLQSNLEAIRQDLKAKRLFTIGWSSGGAGAMRLGKAMRADGILAFSPVLVSTNAKFAHVRSAFEEAAVNDPDYVVDVPKLYRAEYGPNPKTRIFVGADASNDLRFSELVRGVDNVTIEGLNDLDRHASMRSLLQRKMMPGILDNMLSSKP
jgi:hypothetical protein